MDKRPDELRKGDMKMGIIVILFWPLFVLEGLVELPIFALSNILGPFAEAGEVWFDYFSGMISF